MSLTINKKRQRKKYNHAERIEVWNKEKKATTVGSVFFMPRQPSSAWDQLIFICLKPKCMYIFSEGSLNFPPAILSHEQNYKKRQEGSIFQSFLLVFYSCKCVLLNWFLKYFIIRAQSKNIPKEIGLMTFGQLQGIGSTCT